MIVMMNKFEIVDKYAEFAKQTFIRLKAQFGLGDDVSFTVPTITEYMVDEYDARYKDNCDCVQSVMTEITNDYLLEQSFVFTKFDTCEDGNTHYYRIILPKYHISEILVGSNNEQDINAYIEESIKHEIGHVFHAKDIISVFGEGAEDVLNKEDLMFIKDYNAFLTMMDERDDISEYQYQKESITKYYSLSPESDANKFAGVDVDKLIELELKVRIGISE
jgi:hypothetical protein